jgi:hypothetical protein
VFRMKEGKCRSFGRSDGLPATFVTALQEDARGRMWAVSGDSLVRFENDRWSAPTDAAPVSGERAGYFIGWFGAGVIRALGPDGALVKYSLPKGAGPHAWGLYGGQHGVLWVRTADDRFLQLDNGRITETSMPSGSAEEFVPPRFAAAAAGRDRSWLLTKGRLAIREHDTWRWVAGPRDRPFPAPMTMFEDREGSLWIGSESGLIQAVRTPVRNLVPEGRPEDRNVYQLAEDVRGRVWTGALGACFLFEDGRFKRLPWIEKQTGHILAILPRAMGPSFWDPPAARSIAFRPIRASSASSRARPGHGPDARSEGRSLAGTDAGVVVRLDPAGPTRFGTARVWRPSTPPRLVETTDGGGLGRRLRRLSRIQRDVSRHGRRRRARQRQDPVPPRGRARGALDRHLRWGADPLRRSKLVPIPPAATACSTTAPSPSSMRSGRSG